MKYFLRNMNILNILLIMFIALVITRFIFPGFNVTLNKISPARASKVTPAVARPESPKTTPSPADYVLIADNNMFHPERKIPPEKKEEPPPLPRPEVVLYGTLITDDVSLAYLEDLKAPRSTQGRGKRQMTLRKGDVLSGFTLKDVEADKIVMVRGEEKMIVNVKNTQRPASKHTQAQTSPSQHQPQTQEERLRQLTSQPKVVKPATNVVPPKSAFEQSVVDFFEKRK